MIKLLNLKKKYNAKFSILNDTDGEFELRLFEDQYKDNKVDINHFIERKEMSTKVKKINELLIKVCLFNKTDNFSQNIMVFYS